MALAPGDRLGPYEVVAAIAAGGMGEVYRARDTRLERIVAIKVLPEGLASDREFRRRFHGEAKAISQLAHPNICTLHDVGEQDGTTFLVMEFVIGETLAERLARGTPQSPALSVDDSLQIAVQIADALAAAHRCGIVHRDLKPGNIMLTKPAAGHGASHAKLLDFGLAKSGVTTNAGTSTANPSRSGATALTQSGLIVGTVPYMAPEQIENGPIDARTDIFAFGSVVYEMLTNRKAFEGKTQASLMAAILEREPPGVTQFQPGVPGLVEAAIRKCLAKSPEARWQSASDLATALRWIASAQPASSGTEARVDIAPPRHDIRRLAASVGAAITLIAVGAAGAWRYLQSTAPVVETARFEIGPPTPAMFSPSPVASTAQVATSPDGNQIAFVAAARRDVSRVWIRPLDAIQARPLPGTEGASFPFWSADSRSIGFFAAGKLKRIDVAGGTPQPLADAFNGRGGTWNLAGDILFTPSPNGPLYRVAATGGGAVTQETSLSAEEQAVTHYWPWFLPDGRRYLYYQRSADPAHQGIYARTLGANDPVRVLPASGAALYSNGHLLFMRDGMLFAIRFDERTLKTDGEPFRVADNVGYFGGTMGYVAASVSDTGTIVHGPSVLMSTTLQWRDRSGALIQNQSNPGAYRSPRLSPDEQTIVASIIDREYQSPDVYLLDRTRGGLSRVTADPRNDWHPIWSADGQSVYFTSTRAGSSTIYRKNISAVGDGEQIMPTALTGMYTTDASSEGAWLIAHQITAAAGYDVVVVPTTGGEIKPRPFLNSRFNEVHGRFSPNGRWVAYASDESGRFEIYVRPFPSASAQYTISSNGGMQPEWRRDGKELYFLSPEGAIMAVDVTTDAPVFSAGVARKLFDVDVPESAAPYPTDYAVSRDGQRFLVNTVVDQPVNPVLTVILNWSAGRQRF